MKIYSSTQQFYNLFTNSKQLTDKLSLVTGNLPELSHKTDTVEISSTSRQLAASNLVHHPAKYFGTPQINDSLDRLLKDKSPEVKDAVYGIIQFNFINNVTKEEDREALLELGLAQAGYIADNYMNEDESVEFLNTMRQIGAISKTRTINLETNEVHYETPPQKLIGAPDDYIELTDLMKKFEPESLNKLQDAILNGNDWFSIMKEFAIKAASRDDWKKAYREEIAMQNWDVSDKNRFSNAETNSLNDFVKDIDAVIQNDFNNAKILLDNVTIFTRLMKGVI